MSGHDRRSEGRDRRSAPRKLVYTGVTVLLLAAGLELGARLVTDAEEFQRFGQRVGAWMDTGLADFNACLEPDPELFWRLRPDQALPLDRKRPFFGQVSNAAGLRGRVPGPGRADALRVLALGDSCTFGFGADADETWPARLEAALRARHGLEAEVFNAGVPGYSSQQGVVVAERWIPRLAPDVVLVAFGWNDSSVWDGRSDAEHAAPPSGATALLQHSRAFAALRKVLFSWRRSSGGRDAVSPRVSPQAFEDNLDRIASLAREHGAEVVFVAWPFRDQMGESFEGLTAYQRATLDGPGDTVDLVTGFRDHGVEAGQFLDGGHVGPAGYALVARLLAAELPWTEQRPWPAAR